MADAAKKIMGNSIMGKMLGLDEKDENDKKIKPPVRPKPRPKSNMLT